MFTRNLDTSQGDDGLSCSLPMRPDQFRSRALNTGDDALTCDLPAPADWLRARAGNMVGGALAGNLPVPADQLHSHTGNMVFKSGPLYISSKGIGWTSWKKRWFILTRTSLVFFRSDPNIVPRKGEVNLTLGGIDLTSSGSVVVKADKRLLTVLFPDGRDGRVFTLKAETSEDLYEWKAAFENALSQAPGAGHMMGQNGIFKSDAADGSLEQGRDKLPAKSSVIGRPILLALEDIDGSPSFLEKALRFIEQYGVQVEGILRQAADVDDVERRIREYEQGKNVFSPEEDPHVIADCIKHILRELPSSPVPASCCNSLLEACRTDWGVRVDAMRSAIFETFPEPNRRLLQRILIMMRTVASHKSENRMSSSAVAACMAPLLLRPLLAGDCELENDFEMGDDSSVQLLLAAAAANHAQAIVITLLEDYNSIFEEDPMSLELCSESEESGTENEEATDDDENLEEDENYDLHHEPSEYTDDDPDHALSETCSESSSTRYNDLNEEKGSEHSDLESVPLEIRKDRELPNAPQNPSPKHETLRGDNNSPCQSNSSSVMHVIRSCEYLGDTTSTTTPVHLSTGHSPSSSFKKSKNKLNGPTPGVKHPLTSGHISAGKKLPLESIDYSHEEEIAIQRLEVTRTDLQNQISEEAEGNAILRAALKTRKQALHESRLALEQDVARLQEQLQGERDLRASLEAGLNRPLRVLPVTTVVIDKTKVELKEISIAETDVTNLKHKVDDLHVQLGQYQEKNNGSACESCSQDPQTQNHQATMMDKIKDGLATTVMYFHERSTSKQGTKLGREESENLSKQEALTLPIKQPPEKQQLLGQTDHNRTTSAGLSATSSSVETQMVEPTTSNSSKSWARG